MYVRMCSKETLLSGRMKRERTRTWARIGYLPTRGDWVEVYWPAWLCKCAGNFTSSHKQKTRNSVLIYQQFITHKRALYVGSNIRREFHQLSTDAESQFRNMITTDNGKLSIRTNRKTQQITWAVHDAPLFQSFCSMVANGKRFDAKSLSAESAVRPADARAVRVCVQKRADLDTHTQVCMFTNMVTSAFRALEWTTQR